MAELATRQYGVVARRQLLGLGFSVDEVRGLLEARRLDPLWRGVYAVGHRALTRRARWMAAVLACGPGALLSHRSAAAHRGLRRGAHALIEIVVPRERGRGLAGIRTYLCRGLTAADRDEHLGIPCTSVAMTLLGVAAVAGRRQVERACDEAEVQRVLDAAAVGELLARSHRRPGAATLRAVLAGHAAGTTLTRSVLEERALALCRGAGLPAPVVNAPVACGPGVWHTVDFLWPARRVVLETDGHRYHGTPRAIERDRSRDADLTLAGYRVLRATWRQVEREPRRVAAMLRAALSAGQS